MSLDKLLGTKAPKKSEKKPEKKTEKKPDTEPEPILIDGKPSNKHFLKCTDPKCSFKRITRKKTLEKEDFVCTLCKKPLKEYVPRIKAESTEEEES